LLENWKKQFVKIWEEKIDGKIETEKKINKIKIWWNWEMEWVKIFK
jgi:hypothetical protein